MSSRPIPIPRSKHGSTRHRNPACALDDDDDEFVRETPPDHNLELPKHMLHWMPDNTSDQCAGCQTDFNMFFRRRHHCRVCGKLFCYKCCSRTSTIPKLLLDQIPRPPRQSWLSSAFRSEEPSPSESSCRLCPGCFDYVQTTQRAEKYIKALLMCKLDILGWHRLETLSGVWSDAAKLLLSVWRRIQYKNRWLGEELTPLQTQMVKNNVHALYGHARWQQVASQINMWGPPPPTAAASLRRSRQLVSCDDLLCFRYCSGNRMCVADCLEILLTCQHQGAKEHAAQSLLQTDIETLQCFVSTLLYVCAVNKKASKAVLVPLVRQHENFAHKCYWRARAAGKFCQNIRKLILRAVPRQVKERIQESEAWAQSFELAASSDDANYRETVMAPWETKRPCLPGKPNWLVVSTSVRDLIIKKSSSCPAVVPMTLLINGQTVSRHIMYKTDTPLLSDAVVIDAMYLLDLKCRQEMTRRFSRVLFHCVPFSETTGFILLVPNSRTLYSISRSNQSLLNYILSMKPEDTVASVRQRYIESTAFSAVSSLLLGFGDRHNENIMVSGDGCLFHIDFTYVLGSEPGGKAALVSSEPKLRLTTQMCDALGGQDSAEFDAFKQTCTDLYGIAKRNAKSFYYLLYSLVPGNFTTETTIRSHLKSALQPGQNDEEAKLVIEKKIHTATSCRTVDTLLDTIHHWMKTS